MKKKERVKAKFEVRPDRRLLALKGRNISIFEGNLNDKNAKILDFGAGSGAFLQVIYEKGYKNLYACDIDDYIAQQFRSALKDFQVLDESFNRFKF